MQKKLTIFFRASLGTFGHLFQKVDSYTKRVQNFWLFPRFPKKCQNEPLIDIFPMVAKSISKIANIKYIDKESMQKPPEWLIF